MNSTIVVAVIAVAFITTLALGFFIIPFLRRLKYGQTINDIGPTWHKGKQGTPTMGGLLFIAGITLAVTAGMALLSGADSTVLTARNSLMNTRMLAGLMLAVAMGFVGFADDYIKVVKRRNLGLTARQKLLMQIIIACAYLATLYIAGDTSTILMIPFFGQIQMGLWYYPFLVFAIVGVSNASNLTDGLDGLAASVTFVMALSFLILSGLLASYGMTILSAALCGGCAGFLAWNFYPAKVFMGDTGSMFLGGMTIGIAIGLGLPVIIVPIGIIYVMEAASVALQVLSFKTTGKRIFKMSPIHHHFEMSGYSEIKIVILFSVISLLGGAVAVVSVILA